MSATLRLPQNYAAKPSSSTVNASSCTSPRGISARHTQRGFTSSNNNNSTATLAVQVDNGTTTGDKYNSDATAAQAAINHLGLTIACDIKLREANILSRIQEENWPLNSFVHAQWDIKKTQNWQLLLNEIITAWTKHHTELSSSLVSNKNHHRSITNIQKLRQKVLSTLQDITDLLDHAKKALAKVDPRYPTTSEELQQQVTAKNQDALQQIVELCVAVESFKTSSIFNQIWNNGVIPAGANIDISANEISEIETSLEDLTNQLVEPKAWFDHLASSYGKSGSTYRFC